MEYPCGISAQPPFHRTAGLAVRTGSVKALDVMSLEARTAKVEAELATAESAFRVKLLRLREVPNIYGQ